MYRFIGIDSRTNLSPSPGDFGYSYDHDQLAKEPADHDLNRFFSDRDSNLINEIIQVNFAEKYNTIIMYLFSKTEVVSA